MRSWGRRPATAPLPVLFVGEAVVFGGLTHLLDRFLDGDPHDTWLGVVVRSVVFGAVMTAVLGWQRRRNGGAPRQLEMATALRRGELPAGADPATWGPLLDRQERLTRRSLPSGVVVFTAFTVLSVWLAATGEPVWWVFAAFFAGLVLVTVVASRRALRTIGRLRRDLGAPSANGCTPSPLRNLGLGCGG